MRATRFKPRPRNGSKGKAFLPKETTEHHRKLTNAAPTPATGDDIYNAAVAEMKDTLARQGRDQDRDRRRFGELVDKVGKAYGEDKVGKLAEDVGLAASTLRRYRHVTERAKEIETKCALGARFLKYSAVRELLTHPDPAAVERAFKANPALTKKEAQQMMRPVRREQKRSVPYRRKEIKKTLDAIAAAAKTAARLKLVSVPADYALLKELLPEGFAAKLRKGIDGLRRSKEIIEHLDNHIAARRPTAATMKQPRAPA